MQPVELKVARIGNSRGVRIPAATLQRYQIGTTVVMEERSDGILLRPRRSAGAKLSWEETALAMAGEAEDWSAWEASTADGLNEVPWESVRRPRVAEQGSKYVARRRSGKR